jgi:hypothetical protein
MSGVEVHEGISAWLATRSDDELVALVEGRRDLLARPPASLQELGTRLSSTTSMTQAMSELDRGAGQVAALLAYLGGRATPAQLTAALGRTGKVPRGHVQAALTELELRGIAWPVADGKAWRCAGGLAPLVGELLDLGTPLQLLAAGAAPFTMPALREGLQRLGLGVTTSGYEAVARLCELLDDAAAVTRVLKKAPGGVLEAMERLAVGERVELAEVAWLHDRCLVVAGPRGAALPSELVRWQRGDRVVGVVRSQPALVAPKGPPGDGQDQLVALLGDVRGVIRAVVAKPLKALADGGVGVQEQRRLAKALGRDVERVRWLLQLAGDAGLLSRGLTAGTPSREGLDWLEADDVEGGLALVAAGLAQRVVPHEHAGAVLDRSWRGASSGALLADLAAQCLAPATDASLLSWLTWRRAGLSADEADRALALLGDLGLRSGGWPSPWLAPLLDGDEQAAADALRKALPPEQDDVVLQADGTAFVSGRPSDGLRRFLDLLGSRESDRTWRITADGVRTALDAGRTSAALLEELDERSTHAVPQVLSVLISDVGARHGRIRVVPASTLLAIDDEALVAELLHDRLLAGLELSEVRPGVLASTKRPDQVMEALRKAGHAPVGPPAPAVVTAVAKPRVPSPATPAWGPSAREVVAGLRRTPLRPTAAPIETAGGLQSARWVMQHTDQLPRHDLARLVHAVATGLPVEIDYEDTSGTVTSRVVEGLVREGERLAGWCRLRQAERSFYPDRILAVRPVP